MTFSLKPASNILQLLAVFETWRERATARISRCWKIAAERRIRSVLRSARRRGRSRRSKKKERKKRKRRKAEDLPLGSSDRLTALREHRCARSLMQRALGSSLWRKATIGGGEVYSLESLRRVAEMNSSCGTARNGMGDREETTTTERSEGWERRRRRRDRRSSPSLPDPFPS